MHFKADGKSSLPLFKCVVMLTRHWRGKIKAYIFSPYIINFLGSGKEPWRNVCQLLNVLQKHLKMRIVHQDVVHQFMDAIQMINLNCINKAMDRIALENFFSSKNLFIALTYQCNAFCEKCITRYNRFRNQSMTQENCHRLVDFLIENAYSGTINLGSGESLTYEYLPYFVENILKYLPNVRFRILSNGMIFSSKLPKILDEKLDKIGKFW